MVPELDCNLALQLHMGLRGENGSCFYPTPLEQDTIPDQQMLEYHNPVEKDHLFTVMQSCYKATIPIARLRELVDEDNVSDNLSYRCERCSKCQDCKHSNKFRAMSMQERREQAVIEESVTLDTTQRRVTVQLPFMKDPVEKHRSNTNYEQALRVYSSQCWKDPWILEGIQKAHKDLVDRCFMVLMESLDPETVEFIRKAPFRHYYLWSVVNKEDSMSSPVKLVVDPTMSGLNLTLTKGENRIGSLIDILLRNRVLEYACSSNVTKLYNQLHLEKSALPYSLFLYSDDLNPNSIPVTFIMKVLWYGVVPTGNQASYAWSY